MLERNRQTEIATHASTDTRLVDLDRLLVAFLRQWRVLAICTAIGMLLGVIYLTLAPRTYVSAGEILIDQNGDQVLSDSSDRPSSATIETEVLNEMEVLRSSGMARAVVTALHLDTDVEFLNPPPSFTTKISAFLTGWFSRSDREQVTQVSVEVATRALMAAIVVERQGRSSVINVGYFAASPSLAYRIASAYVREFLREQRNADVTTQATSWLQQQLIQLGEARRQASDAVEQFRAQSGHSVQQDKTLSDQRIQALTAQLVVAQSETARVRALSQQVQAAIDKGPSAAGVNAPLLLGASDTPDQAVTTLLAQYANTTRRVAEVNAAFGPNHQQLAVLQRDLASLSDQIYGRLQQLNERYANDLRIAEGRETALRQDVQDEGQQSAETSQSQVKLNELEQKASALEGLYNSFLTRYEESVQRQSVPVTSARVISAPVETAASVRPQALLSIAGGTLLGLFFGVCFGAINELRERSIRLGSQISNEFGLRFAGYLPEIRLRRSRKASASLPDEQMHDQIRQQMITARAGGVATAFIESLKSSLVILHELRKDGRGVVVGVSSVLPGEGKTTYAVALAEMLASTGARVLLIDSDLRHPAASRLTSPYASAGLIEAVSGQSWRDLVTFDETTRLTVLPALSSLDHAVVGDPLLSEGIAELMLEVRSAFEFVVIDMPPLGPIADARSLLPLTDGLMLVVEWGRTAKRLVRSTLENDPHLEQAVLGAVLNRVDFDKLPRYSQLGESERYIGAYETYYRVVPAAKA